MNSEISMLQRIRMTDTAIRDLHNGSSDVMLRIADAALETKMQKRKIKEFELKEDAVKKVHVTGTGMPRSISEKQDESGKTYYLTKVKGKKQICSYSYESLIEKLYEYYKAEILPPEECGRTLAAVFPRALNAYKVSKNPSYNTLYKYEKDFKRFLAGSSLAQKDVCDVTAFDIQVFTQEMVRRQSPKIKAFRGYVSLLNLIFKHARDPEKLITNNPVDLIDFSPYLKSCDQSRPKSKDKILSPEEIDQIRNVCFKRITSKPYYVRGYMMLLAIESGMRAGELCSLKWNDVKWENRPTDPFDGPCLHIHSQQLSNYGTDGRLYYTYVGWTKDEKGISKGGRYFPLTQKIHSILTALRIKQEELGIYDPNGYIFLEDGKWVTTVSYEKCLKRVCDSLGFEISNNHAFRMSLNSNVFIPLGIPVTTRALWLGHSVEVNLKHYSYAEKKTMGEYGQRLDAAEISQKDRFAERLYA